MPQINPGDSQNLNLEAGKVLTVSCTSTASAIVRAFPMAAGTEQTSQTSVAANGSQAFGPFLVPTRWEIDTFGPGASYTVGDSPSAVAGETLVRVDAQTGSLLGNGRSPVSGAGNRRGQALTRAGSFAADAVAKSIAVGWRPDFLVAKSSAAAAAALQTNLAWHRRTDALINLESVGRADTPVGADTGGGITLTETGFDVGANSRVNGNGATIYWWAFRDQLSKSLLQSSYAGNAVAGRTVDVFEGRKLALAFVKRDYTPGPVWMVPGKQAFHWTGAAMSVSAGTGLSADGTTITVGAGPEINGWSGPLGEAMGLYGIPADSEAINVKPYVGNGAQRRLSFPWEPECLWFIPLNTAIASPGRVWIAGMPAGASGSFGAGAVAVDANVITVVQENTVVIGTNAAVNEAGRDYVVVAFKKTNQTAFFDTAQRGVIYRKAVQCPVGGYIDCGTDESLNVQLPRTLEFYGSAQPPTSAQTPMAGGAGVDTEANKQVPIMFRSGGNDGAADAVSYGFELCAPTAHDSSGLSRGPTILVARRDVWTLPPDNLMANLDPYPMNTGFVPPTDGRAIGHYLVTEELDGTYRVYFDGEMVKEAKRDLRGVYGHNGRSYSGHRLVFGGRRESAAVTDANGHSLRMARVYNRALTPAEVRQNFASLTGQAQPVQGFVEMWDASDASGNTLPAKVNPANNGLIVNGTVDG